MNNWQTKKLNDLCEIELGKTPYRGNSKFWDREKNTDNVWLSIADLLNTDGNIISESKEYISEDGAKLCKIVRRGTLLASFKLTLGRLAFAGGDLYTNEAIAALTIKNEKELSKEYLYHFLSFFDWHEAVKGDVKVKGKTLNKAKLKEIKIFFPSLLEQHRIVKILDEIFEKINEAKENTEKNLKNSRELFESYLQSVFANSKYEYKLLGDVCKIVGGGTPSKAGSNFVKYYNGEIPWATVRDMRNDIVSETEHRITKEAVKNSSTNIIPKNNVIIATRVGLGKVCFLENDTAINQDLRGVIPFNPNKLSVNYLFWWLKSISEIFIKNGTGATVHGVKLPFVKELKMPFPSLTEQKSIVKKLDALFSEAKKLEAIYKQKLADLEELKKSVLKKAFNGEL